MHTSVVQRMIIGFLKEFDQVIFSVQGFNITCTGLSCARSNNIQVTTTKTSTLGLPLCVTGIT